MLADSMIDQKPIGRKRSGGRWLILALIVLGIGLFLAYGPDEQTVLHRSAEWREAARNHLFVALVLFFIAEVILIAFSVPVGIWLTVLAGFLFGTWIGTAVVNLGATTGAILAFLSARYVFAGSIHRAASTRPRLGRWLTAIDAGFHNHGAYYVLLLRLIPLFPFWTINLGLGLTSVRLRDYWWATQLGMLPISLVTANAGASLAEITSFRDVLSLQVLGALCLLPLVAFVLHHLAGRWLTRASHPPSPPTPLPGGEGSKSKPLSPGERGWGEGHHD
ncbi:MAG TPA: TVP38/TMEM64 family protein [Gemmata sp.]|jgi:uncharacterized membrane protein YdjX (TVP38/TMEM64 family)|nr:TVP38/TMEM64 family protein [Gemmata sp.]